MTKPKRTKAVTCRGCEHSLVMTCVPHFDFTGHQFLCGYETPLDSNLPGEVIGLSEFRLEWCPVKVDFVQLEIQSPE